MVRSSAGLSYEVVVIAHLKADEDTRYGTKVDHAPNPVDSEDLREEWVVAGRHLLDLSRSKEDEKGEDGDGPER